MGRRLSSNGPIVWFALLADVGCLPTNGAADGSIVPDVSITPDAPVGRDVSITPDAPVVRDVGTAVDAASRDDVPIDVVPLDVASARDVGYEVVTADAPATRDAGPVGLDVGTVSDSAASPSDGGALPALDASTGPLPLPTRDPATWGPLRITRRELRDGALVPVERQVFGYSDRRVNSVVTELWRSDAWAPSELTTWVYSFNGTLEARILWRYGAPLTQTRRWRYEYNGDGTLRVERVDLRSGTNWVEFAQYTWEWVDGRPAWHRYFEAPTPGGVSVRMWENAFEYDPRGRLTGLVRIERQRPTDSFVSGGRRILSVLPSGHLDRDALVLNGVRTEQVYRYDARGAVLEVAGADAAVRYHYDPLGRLQFVRNWTRFDGAWSQLDELEIEPTPEGSDLTFAMDVAPLEVWRRDRYGRGDLVDRYRR